MAVPTLEPSDALWQQAQAERAFWQRNHRTLLEKYPEQFVAVRDGAVVATAPNLDELLRLLERQGLKPTDVWARFITATRRATFL